MPKRPRDVNEMARSIVDEATGDAHTPDQLTYVDSGAWMARQAGIGPELLLNCLEIGDLRAALR